MRVFIFSCLGVMQHFLLQCLFSICLWMSICLLLYIYVNQIKTANNAVGDLVFFVFFCKSSDAVEWSCFFLIH